MKIIDLMGDMFKVSNATYKAIIQEIADTGCISLDKHKTKYLGIVHKITDMESEHAKDIINDLDS